MLENVELLWKEQYIKNLQNGKIVCQITPSDTLIVLDEIQDVPEALEALKYFREDAPDYHVAVAGSLLGISLHNDTSYPVGQVNELNVYPMSFEEFLLANLEIDFVIQRDAKLLPIEVKAEGNVRANSLTNVLKANPVIHAIRYSMLPYKEQEQMTNVPLYAVR